MRKNILWTIIGVAILILGVIFLQYSFDDCKFQSRSLRGIEPTTEINFEKGIEVWANKVVKEKNGCLFKNYGGTIYEFIAKNTYTKEKFPDAILLDLRPVDLHIIKDKICGIDTCGQSTLIKFLDRNNVVYLAPESVSRWTTAQISQESISQNSDTYADILLRMVKIFQSQDEKFIAKIKSGMESEKFYQCINRSDFQSIEKQIIKYCPSYNNDDWTKNPVETTTMPYECGCKNINRFLIYQAESWRIKYDLSKRGIY